MRAPLLKRLDDLRSNFWFLPVVMAACGAALAILTTALDRSGWLHDLGPMAAPVGHAGARSLLSTLAAACMTVAGVVFSVILVSLSLAASQLGPRILRNFLQRGGTQIVVGMLLGTFVFCLLALRGISYDDGSFQPRIVILVGLGLGIMTFVALISFIHRMVHFIQAPHALAAVAEELRDAVCRALPEREEHEPIDEPALPLWARTDETLGEPVGSPGGGYIQAIDYEGLAEAMRREDARMRFLVRPGAFVSEGQTIAHVIPARDEAPDEVPIGEYVMIGPNRSAAQDPEFLFAQLVEVAIRALSPGINDAFTAGAAIDRIGEGLRLAAGRKLPSAVVCDEEDVPRVRVQHLTHADLVRVALRRVRFQTQRDPLTTERMLAAIESVGRADPQPAFAEALWQEAQRIVSSARTEAMEPDDAAALDAALGRVAEALGQTEDADA